MQENKPDLVAEGIHSTLLVSKDNSDLLMWPPPQHMGDQSSSPSHSNSTFHHIARTHLYIS